MQVRVRIAHRADRPRADGSPGFQDLAAGAVIEMAEADFNPALHEEVEPRASERKRSAESA
jgi:hypothetical protein